jgi:hypothetical protein
MAGIAAYSLRIATLGLVLNSPAVVIGAMRISPLMAPPPPQAPAKKAPAKKGTRR